MIAQVQHNAFWVDINKDLVGLILLNIGPPCAGVELGSQLTSYAWMCVFVCTALWFLNRSSIDKGNDNERINTALA